MDRRLVLAPALLIGVAFMSSTLVTPLYALYRDAFHFSEITLTLVYSVYVVGNLVALLFFGRISDKIGRRPVALPAIVVACGGTILFICAGGTVWLFAARLLSGAVGLASGTGTAWLVDLYGSEQRPQATLAATFANLTGAAVGPLLSGLLAQYAPRPLQLSFYVYLVLLLVTALAVTRSRETLEKPESLGDVSFEPNVGVPREIRDKFIAPATAAFGAFALAGFYFALLPGVLSRDLGQANLAVAGAVVFEAIAGALLAILLTREVKSDKSMMSGLWAQLPSVALLILAQGLKSMPILLLGSAVTGISLGLGYRGSLQVVNELAPDDKRAEVVSTFFAVIFTGNSVPIIGIGVLTTLSNSFTADIVFACMIACFATAAALKSLSSRAQSRYTPQTARSHKPAHPRPTNQNDTKEQAD